MQTVFPSGKFLLQTRGFQPGSGAASPDCPGERVWHGVGGGGLSLPPCRATHRLRSATSVPSVSCVDSYAELSHRLHHTGLPSQQHHLCHVGPSKGCGGSQEGAGVAQRTQDPAAPFCGGWRRAAHRGCIPAEDEQAFLVGAASSSPSRQLSPAAASRAAAERVSV